MVDLRGAGGVKRLSRAGILEDEVQQISVTLH